MNIVRKTLIPMSVQKSISLLIFLPKENMYHLLIVKRLLKLQNVLMILVKKMDTKDRWLVVFLLNMQRLIEMLLKEISRNFVQMYPTTQNVLGIIMENLNLTVVNFLEMSLVMNHM